MDAPQPSLQNLIGENVVARIIAVDENLPTLVKLVAMESAGLWIESQKVTEHYLAELEKTMSPRTFVFFVPFSEISWIMSTAEYPALSSKII